MQDIPKVLVMMSTYNGEKYIKQQIDSILAQKGVEVYLTIRDDGSSDCTHVLLEEYSKKDNICVFFGKNIGFAESFWKLMVFAESKYDYYAFSDQDDVWLENKLACAVEMLHDKTIPALYCANFWLVDAQLNKIEQEPVYGMNGLSYHNLIITNLRACGNTMVWNNKLERYIKMFPDRGMIITFHDLWVEFMAAMLGEIIIDSRRTILYRQHANNTSGGSRFGGLGVWWCVRKKTLLARLNGPDERKHYEEYRARNFLARYRDYLADEYVEDLENVINYRKSIFSTLKILKSRVGRGVPLRVKIRILIRRI